MSVGDEPNECPLCMEPLEPDDLNFFPCTCGYQICRFCWHRIRTDENGLCPACRKQYPEDPAEFKPLTDDEVQNIKKERKLKENQRKQKAAESRKHLANVRVVQKNLVFVVGLSPRLADPDTLKRQEYFGKFGKIHKVVINQSTSYAGSQGPSASAYVTYVHAADALRAIINVNNIHIDGRTLKTSLGTTKYCSHFLRSSQCTKPDCMYLHELGEEAASFTKEEMQLNKHQEYEQKLLEQFLNSQNNANNHIANNKTQGNKKMNTLTQAQQHTHQQADVSQHSPPLPGSNKQSRFSGTGSHTADTSQGSAQASDAWPSLQPCQGAGGSMAGSKTELLSNGSRSSSNNSLNRTNTPPATTANGSVNKAVGNERVRSFSENHQNSDKASSDADSTSDSPLSHIHGQLIQDSNGESVPTQSAGATHSADEDSTPTSSHNSTLPASSQQHLGYLGVSRHQSGFSLPNNSLSLFTNTSIGGRAVIVPTQTQQTCHPDNYPAELPESITVSSTEDWNAAFGFQAQSTQVQQNEDDLDFDPCTESLKGFQALIENGKQSGNASLYSNSMAHDQFNYSSHNYSSHMPPAVPHDSLPHVSGTSQHNLPPGFSHTYLQHQQQQIQQFYHPELTNSRLLDFMNFTRQQHTRFSSTMQHNSYHHPSPDPHLQSVSHPQPVPAASQNDGYHMQKDVFSMRGMQEQLRSMLPNVNISFGSPPQAQIPPRSQSQHQGLSHPASTSDTNWLASDPAIVATNPLSRASAEEAPHWMRSIHQLTESDGPLQNSRFSFAQQIPLGPATGWPQQMQNPPPGFRNPMRTNVTEAHTLAEALQ